MDLFLLRLPWERLCPRISTSPRYFHSPTWSYSLERQEGQTCCEAARGCSGGAVPCGAGETWAVPQQVIPWAGDWEPELLCLVTNYLGPPWPSHNPVPHLQGRGEVRVQWARGCRKGRRWGAGAVVPGERRIISAAGSGVWCLLKMTSQSAEGDGECSPFLPYKHQ